MLPNWMEIKTDKVQVYQLGDEPELIYVIKIRNNEYMIIHEDAYDLHTGKVEFVNDEELKNKFGIEKCL